MKRHPIGTPVNISGCAFRGRSGVVVETSSADQKTWPDYQRVAIDKAFDLAPQLILVTDCAPFEKRGQIDLFGGVA